MKMTTWKKTWTTERRQW